MDIALYRKYLQEYVSEAIKNSDGTVKGVREYLDSVQIKGLLVRHKLEKRRALEEAQGVFEKNRHWPLEIVLSHLGVDAEGHPG